MQVFGQYSQGAYEKRRSFYPDIERINQENIEWGFFSVPENWEKTTDKKVKLAVAILKNTSEKKNANPVVMSMPK